MSTNSEKCRAIYQKKYTRLPEINTFQRVRDSEYVAWLESVVAGRSKNKVDTASHNSAMVPCPQHDAIDGGCPLHAHVWLCGIKPCMIARHQ